MWFVQRYLLKMGAKLLDPFNIAAFKSVPRTECRILVHSPDLPLVHCTPNLLRLKRHMMVTFLMFDNLNQVQSNKCSIIFPSAGTVIMDMPSLMSCKSGTCFPISLCSLQLADRSVSSDIIYLSHLTFVSD